MNDSFDGDLLDTNAQIEISVNEEPDFIWRFSANHFVFVEIRKTLLNWRDQVGIEMFKQLGNDSPEQELIASWLINSRNWDKIMNASPKARQSHPEIAAYFYALPLNSVETRLFAFQKVLESPLALQLESFAKKLLTQFPRNDLATEQVIQGTLANADYPYLYEPLAVPGNPHAFHVFNHPHVIYTRVSQEDLAMKWGDYAALKMGRTWSRDVFGYRLAIGEALKTRDGSNLLLPFEEAKTTCLLLNPSEKRSTTAEVFNSRETLLHSIRISHDGSEETLLNQLAQIYQNHPIQGCYLMSLEEWQFIASDFGAADHPPRYLPQILPGLFQTTTSPGYWTSSVDEQRAFFALIFDSSDGSIELHPRNDTYSVRCACQSKKE